MEKPKTLTVTLETVTPLFLGGADPRGTPELRAPAFRGALRYWLRAMLGGAVGDTTENLHKLHACESAVFGSTDEKTGGASAVTIRLRTAAQPTSKIYEKQKPVFFNNRRQPTGRDYLYWSMGESGSQRGVTINRPSSFTLLERHLI